MKNNYVSGISTLKSKIFLLGILFILIIFKGQAQIITGNNPYCISSSPTYTVNNAGAAGNFDRIEWLSNDPGISFSGNPAPATISKVVIKSGNIISAPSYIYARIYSGTTLLAETPHFDFLTATPPSTPSYYVTKSSDYCTSQYHIITLNVIPNPNSSPNTNFTISPRVPDTSIIITQTSKNVFELKLPLNGQPYFLYDVTSTTSSSGCLSNSVTTTSYGNSVSLNLTGCANTTPAVNYDFTVYPNPYSNGYITIAAPAITPTFTGTICRVYNSSGVLKATFPLSNSSTAFPLKATVGSALTTGLYVVQVTYPNGIVKTQNLVVN